MGVNDVVTQWVKHRWRYIIEFVHSALEGQPFRKAATVFLLVALAVAARGIAAREYVASMAFTIEGGGGALPAWSGIASQFGVDLPFGEASDGLEFYVELSTSRDILARLARENFVVPGGNTQRPLMEILDRGGDDAVDSLQRAVRQLKKRIRVSPAPEAGWIRVVVRMPGDSLAEAVSRGFLRIINDAGIGRLQSRASIQREFVEKRWQDAGDELASAEDSLRRFLEQNRTVLQSPRLQMESTRFERQIGMRQTVFTALAQMREQARLEELRATPVISVVESPDGSAEEMVNPLLLGLVSGAGALMLYLAWYNRQRILAIAVGSA